MKLIVGLGNPGPKYEKTRHNLGFRVIDYLKEHLEEKNYLLLKPQTFINQSGKMIKSMVDYHKTPLSEILVIHDDIDLPLGEIKIQQGRGAAGHKGVQSIIDQLKSKNFIRMRIGIKPKQGLTIPMEKFVLEKFTPEEEKNIQETIKKAAQIIKAALGERS